MSTILTFGSNNFLLQDLETMFSSYRSQNSAKQLGFGGVWKILLFAVLFLIIAIVVSGPNSKKYMQSPIFMCQGNTKKCTWGNGEGYNLF